MSHRPLGIFQAVRDLRDADALSEHEERWADELMAWFAEHLRRPDRLAWSGRPNAPERALSWFRASATEHVRRARELAALLEQRDLRVEVLRTERPGYVLYEDEVQVVAMPFEAELSS